ncbi:MFS transporter [Ramlibacter pinisoli]|nr:MFS transporter [Ramlibacter pinisoli]
MPFARVPSPAATAPSHAAGDTLWSAFRPLLPLMAAVYASFFAAGMALPVLPRHLHDTLGQGPLWVGIVMGAQYLASIALGRRWAGQRLDALGPRPVMVAGALGIAAVGVVYGLALLPAAPRAATLVLVAARLLTGVAEAFVMTAALGWGVARLGPAHAGKVFGWIGVALFGGFGSGAPAGSWLHAQVGFAGIALATAGAPLLTAALAARLATPPPAGGIRPGFLRVLRSVRLPGLALTLSSLGYAALNAFIALLFDLRGWGSAAFAFTCFGIGFIAARLWLGHLPDRIGGARVAMPCVAAEAIGQLLIWAAPTPLLAWLGAGLTGAGYALAFQGFGVEAVRRAPPQARGAAMAGYVVFQDLSMGLAGPLGGWLAGTAGLPAVYLAGALGAAGAVLLAAWLQRR